MVSEKFFARDEDIIRQGESPKHVYLVMEGWVSRFRNNHAGKKQVLNYQLPGDFCNLHTTLAKKMDHTISALVPSKIGFIPHHEIYNIYENHPHLAQSLNWTSLIDISILQEWLVNLGLRSSDQRLAHLLCELLIRARAAGLTDDHRFELPLTQAQLGEAIGITQVHTNRVMQRLLKEGLITFKNKKFHIDDWNGMKEYADFDALYLHLECADSSLEKDI
ncbi:Crp/Fnr family transcriptional regulator [Vreelandella zhuhanensis]|uniref:Crp/Fnr family transcriptional regulator n=1 Tax=Vreelandella zhuhanensis TaxID=2684210 RepID=UPI0029E7DD82|nr:Crp/Fnr family transcriptional regulator [Halomonas zhuhanensis]